MLYTPIFRYSGVKTVKTKYAYRCVRREIMLKRRFSKTMAFEYIYSQYIGIGVGSDKRHCCDNVMELLNNMLSNSLGSTQRSR